LNYNVPNQSWSIIILCFNEEACIKKVIDDSLQTLKEISKNAGELIIVNDGSKDHSHQIITESIKGHSNIKYIIHKKNKGIGESLHSGYSKAEEENVVMVAGDGQFDVRELIPHKNIPSNSFVSFYRVNNLIYNKRRKILSSINRTLNKYLLGLQLRDVNFTKVYKSSIIKKLNLKTRSSLVESEICAKLSLLGQEAIEVESEYQYNLGGNDTGASVKIIKQALWDLPRLIWVCLIFRLKNRTS